MELNDSSNRKGLTILFCSIALVFLAIIGLVVGAIVFIAGHLHWT